MVKYTSDRFFRMWAFIPSHSSLLLRSNKSLEHEIHSNEFTIDIEFWEVSYIQMPDAFSTVELREKETGYPAELEQFITSDTRVFELRSKGNKYFIIAAGCLVGRSNWDYNINRLFDLKLEYDEILFKSNS